MPPKGTNTELFLDINTTGGTGSSDPSGFTALGEWLYFFATQGDEDNELWRTNGTITYRVADINPGAGGSNPRYFTLLGSYLYFQADDGVDGRELWRTNGTSAELVANIDDVNDNSSYPSGFTAFGDWLYFNASDGVHGPQLWRTNGTSTEMGPGLNESGAANSYPNDFVALGDWLYFRADDGTSGSELWRTNGTSTTRVADINTTGNAGSFPNGLTVLGSYIYFNANDPANDKLWRVSTSGIVESASPAGTNVFFGCMCDHPILTLDGRLFAPVSTDESGFEFAYLDERTFGLPGTNRGGLAWSAALVLLAAVTAVAGVGLRLRNGSLAK